MVKPFCRSKKGYRKLLEEHVEGLSSLQQLHYASNRYALLLIFQAMDAAGKTIWKERYRSIVDLEEHLHRNGTRIVKFFLHLSKNEQRKRFLERIDAPDKNWKFSLSDIHERKYWKHYMKVYEACLNATSTDHAPWFVVPADDKENARLIVSQIILDTLESLKMSYPKASKARRKELQAIRKSLAK
jgi:polyphosphate kinase 2 (PPK2 family)